MAESTKFKTIPLRYSGVFDLSGLYYATKAWYTSVYATVNWEKLYKDKVSGPGVREVEINMVGFVKWDRYRRWVIEVSFKSWDIKEVVVDGKSVVQGRIEIKIDGQIDYDYADMYTKNAKSKFVKLLGKILQRVVKKDKDFAIKSKCEKEMMQLQTQFKKILQMPA